MLWKQFVFFLKNHIVTKLEKNTCVLIDKKSPWTP